MTGRGWVGAAELVAGLLAHDGNRQVGDWRFLPEWRDCVDWGTAPDRWEAGRDRSVPWCGESAFERRRSTQPQLATAEERLDALLGELKAPSVSQYYGPSWYRSTEARTSRCGTACHCPAMVGDGR